MKVHQGRGRRVRRSGMNAREACLEGEREYAYVVEEGKPGRRGERVCQPPRRRWYRGRPARPVQGDPAPDTDAQGGPELSVREGGQTPMRKEGRGRRFTTFQASHPPSTVREGCLLGRRVSKKGLSVSKSRVQFQAHMRQHAKGLQAHGDSRTSGISPWCTQARLGANRC